MVDLVIWQSVSYVAAALGVCVAAIYYSLTLRSNNRARQAQLYMWLYDKFSSSEINKHYLNVTEPKWRKNDDLVKEFSPENPEKYVSLCVMLSYYEGLGVLVEEGLIDIRLVYPACFEAIKMFWETVAPIIEQVRKSLGVSSFGSKTEYLYNRIVEYGKRH